MIDGRADVSALLAGVAFPGVPGIPYPRARPADAERLPADTWAAAQLPVGVRVELTGDTGPVVIEYETQTDDLGYRGEGAGTSFVSWDGAEAVDEAPAVLGRGRVTLQVAPGRAVVTLPEGMRPTVLGVSAASGAPVRPAPRQPRWLCYGDSIAEGWVASGPGRAWPALTGRLLGLDVVNLGYGGAARGEMVMAEAMAGMPADVISLSHGTNCWQRITHSAEQVGAGLDAFLTLLRTGHPTTPVVVVSPIVRPDAETTPNAVGTTLAGIRHAIEETVRRRRRSDPRLWLVAGADLVPASDLVDGVHPGDAGHLRLAEAVGGALRRALAGSGVTQGMATS